jgi:hypothetical protein
LKQIYRQCFVRLITSDICFGGITSRSASVEDLCLLARTAAHRKAPRTGLKSSIESRRMGGHPQQPTPAPETESKCTHDSNVRTRPTIAATCGTGMRRRCGQVNSTSVHTPPRRRFGGSTTQHCACFRRGGRRSEWLHSSHHPIRHLGSTGSDAHYNTEHHVGGSRRSLTLGGSHGRVGTASLLARCSHAHDVWATSRGLSRRLGNGGGGFSGAVGPGADRMPATRRQRTWRQMGLFVATFEASSSSSHHHDSASSS